MPTSRQHRHRGLSRAVRATLLTCAALTAITARADTAPDWSEVGKEAADLLARYIRIDTTNPPGTTTAAVEYLRPLLEEAGLTVETTGGRPSMPILVGKMEGSGDLPQPIVLLHHMDVVAAEADKWSADPFSGEIRDGDIYGRGALDIKGLGIVQLAALRLLARRGERPKHDILFLAVPDEEVGGIAGVGWLDQNRPDIMNAAGVWDEGGFGIADAFSRPVMFISVTEKRALWIRIVAEGPSGHGSRPFPESATVRLHNAVERILQQPPPSRLVPAMRVAFRRLGKHIGGTRGFFMRYIDNPLIWPWVRRRVERDSMIAPSVRDTISLTMLKAGYKPNVIPERAEAVIDCRLLPGTKQSLFLAHLERVVDDAEIRFEVFESSPPARPSPMRNDLYRAIEASAGRVYSDAVVTPYMAIGATDSRFFRRRGVPAYGLMPIIVPQDMLTTIHGIDERIPVDTLGPAVRVVYDALREL